MEVSGLKHSSTKMTNIRGQGGQVSSSYQWTGYSPAYLVNISLSSKGKPIIIMINTKLYVNDLSLKTHKTVS